MTAATAIKTLNPITVKESKELNFINLFGGKNSLINFLTNEDGTVRNIIGQFIDEEGEVAGIPLSIKLSELEHFVTDFEGAYIIFRDSSEEMPLLFEVSDGMLCFVTPEQPIKRSDVRDILHHSGIKESN